MARPSLKYYYDLFNKRYFRNKLPKDCRVFWADLTEYNANGLFQASYGVIAELTKGPRKGQVHRISGSRDTIRIDTALLGNKTVALMILLHEMCHLKLKRVHRGHGTPFQKEMKKLAARGAFRDKW